LPASFPEFDCHSVPSELKQGFFRVAAQVQDDAVLVAHRYSAYAAHQDKTGFTGQRSAFDIVKSILEKSDRGEKDSSVLLSGREHEVLLTGGSKQEKGMKYEKTRKQVFS